MNQQNKSNLELKNLLLQLYLALPTQQKPLFVICEFLQKLLEKDLLLDEAKKMFKTWSALEFATNFKITIDSAIIYQKALLSEDKLLCELEKLSKINGHIVAWFESDYPSKLRTINYPPFFLFVQGNLPYDGWNFGIVGSRESKIYGKEVLQSILPNLISSGATIISGGAEGVDGYAHDITCNLGGKTVVIVGSGLGTTYPKIHKKLFEKVVSNNGALVSIFPFDTPPLKNNFPIRNRIISGMSEGILVVEASLESGSLITAGFALEQGREVFAIPGQIGNKLSKGPHKLLREGAVLVESAHDILQIFADRLDLKENIFLNTTISIKPATKIKTSSNISPILEALHSPKSMDELMLILNQDEETILNELFNLEIDGLIKQNFSGKWERN